MNEIEKLEKLVTSEVFKMYGLVDGTKGKLKYFEKMLNLSPEDLKGAGELELSAISLMIMYRHLQHHDRIRAMQIIQSVPNRRLKLSLEVKLLDTTYINPTWGPWSKSTEELESDLKVNEYISIAGMITGATTFSGMFAWDFYHDNIKPRKVGPKSIATIVIAVILFANDTALNANQDEVLRRRVTQQTQENPRTSTMFKTKSND
ncbi:MAG: hypothetical protein VX185_16975 [Pseudomonadota bacterium]|nr:hypothetical protein [Pseudomonadota bacterium]